MASRISADVGGAFSQVTALRIRRRTTSDFPGRAMDARWKWSIGRGGSTVISRCGARGELKSREIRAELTHAIGARRAGDRRHPGCVDLGRAFWVTRGLVLDFGDMGAHHV